MLFNVLTLERKNLYNEDMKKQQKEIKAEIIGELDLTYMPKDIFDTLIGALLDKVIESTESDNCAERKD